MSPSAVGHPTTNVSSTMEGSKNPSQSQSAQSDAAIPTLTNNHDVAKTCQEQDYDGDVERAAELDVRSSRHPALAHSKVPENMPYSVFSKRQKWAIICLAAFSGIFSPLGAFVYLPALPTLTKAFHTTTQKIKWVSGTFYNQSCCGS